MRKQTFQGQNNLLLRDKPAGNRQQEALLFLWIIEMNHTKVQVPNEFNSLVHKLFYSSRFPVEPGLVDQLPNGMEDWQFAGCKMHGQSTGEFLTFRKHLMESHLHIQLPPSCHFFLGFLKSPNQGSFSSTCLSSNEKVGPFSATFKTSS